MKTALRAMGLSILTGCAAIAAASADTLVISSSGNGQVMRNGPGEDFNGVYHLENGQRVETLGAEDGHWILVQAENGITGWVLAWETRPAEASATAAPAGLSEEMAQLADCAGEAWGIHAVWEAILTDLPRLEHREIAAAQVRHRYNVTIGNPLADAQMGGAFVTRQAGARAATIDLIVSDIEDTGDVLTTMDWIEQVHYRGCGEYLR